MISTSISVSSYSNSPTDHYGAGKGQAVDEESKNTEVKSEKETDKNTKTGDPLELTDKEQKEVEELKNRDAEVKAHEMAHMAAGGQYAGVASFEYQTAPNGVKYATGGEVQIDVSEVSGDLQATITKMEIVQKAALAPAEPSAADRSIAASASIKEMEARGKLMQERIETVENSPGNPAGKEEYSSEQTQSDKGKTLDIVI